MWAEYNCLNLWNVIDFHPSWFTFKVVLAQQLSLRILWTNNVLTRRATFHTVLVHSRVLIWFKAWTFPQNSFKQPQHLCQLSRFIHKSSQVLHKILCRASGTPKVGKTLSFWKMETISMNIRLNLTFSYRLLSRKINKKEYAAAFLNQYSSAQPKYSNLHHANSQVLVQLEQVPLLWLI